MEVRPDNDEPTLLFDDLAFGVPAAATIFEDWLYTFTCGEGDGWEHGCRLARVDLDEVTDPSAWRFWDGQRWTRRVGEALVLFSGGSAMSLHWSPQAGAWVAVHADPELDTVLTRTAATLRGPWSRELGLFSTEPSWDDRPPQAAFAHAEYTREIDGGWAEYVTYYRSPEDRSGEIRLVRVELAPR